MLQSAVFSRLFPYTGCTFVHTSKYIRSYEYQYIPGTRYYVLRIRNRMILGVHGILTRVVLQNRMVFAVVKHSKKARCIASSIFTILNSPVSHNYQPFRRSCHLQRVHCSTKHPHRQSHASSSSHYSERSRIICVQGVRYVLGVLGGR